MASHSGHEGTDDKVKVKITDRGKGTTHQIGTRNEMFIGFDGPAETDSTEPISSSAGSQQGNVECEINIEGEDVNVQTGSNNVLYQHKKAGPNTQKPKEQRHVQEGLKHPVQESEIQNEKVENTREETVASQPDEQIEDTSLKARSSDIETATYKDDFKEAYCVNNTPINDLHELSENRSGKDITIVDGTINETAVAASSPLINHEEVISTLQIKADARVINNFNQTRSKSEATKTFGETPLRPPTTQVKTREPIVFREIRGKYLPQQRRPIVDIHAEDRILDALADSGDNYKTRRVLRVAWIGLDVTSDYKTVWKISGVSKEIIFTELLGDVMTKLRWLIVMLFERYQALLQEVKTGENVLLIFHHTDEQSARCVVHLEEEVCKILKTHLGHLNLDISFQDDQSSGREKSAETFGQQTTGQQDVRPKQFNRPVDEAHGVKNEKGGNEEIHLPNHWEWQDDNGSWIKFEEKQNAKLEIEYSSKSKTCVIGRDSKGFRVNFSTMMETNIEERGSPKRKVRRMVTQL